MKSSALFFIRLNERNWSWLKPLSSSSEPPVWGKLFPGSKCASFYLKIKSANLILEIFRFKHGTVERKPCTIPQPFSLHGSTTRPTPMMMEDEAPVFHAKPVSKRMMEAPIGVPAKKAAVLIEPQSPAFALKSRMAERNLQKAPIPEPEPEAIVRARPAPHRGVPVSLPSVSKKSTQPAPFSFDQRDHEMMAKKEEKIKKVLDEEQKAREFHANPVPKAVETGGR